MTKEFVIKLLEYGLLIAVVTIAAFHIGLKTNPAMASTMAFATLTLARLFHGFNCRSSRSIFKIGFNSNKWSIGAFLLGVLLLATVLFVPFMKSLFLVESMILKEILIVLGLSVLPTFLVQLLRLARKGE